MEMWNYLTIKLQPYNEQEANYNLQGFNITFQALVSSMNKHGYENRVL
jgi:hypothetical protein